MVRARSHPALSGVKPVTQMRAFQFFACTSQCFRWSGRCVPLSFCQTCGLTGVSTCRRRCCRWRFDGSAAVPRARSCPSQSLNLPQEGVQLLLRCRHPLVGTVRPQQLLRFAALAQNPLDSVKITFSHPKHSLRLLPDGICCFLKSPHCWIRCWSWVCLDNQNSLLLVRLSGFFSASGVNSEQKLRWPGLPALLFSSPHGAGATGSVFSSCFRLPVGHRRSCPRASFSSCFRLPVGHRRFLSSGNPPCSLPPTCDLFFLDNCCARCNNSGSHEVMLN